MKDYEKIGDHTIKKFELVSEYAKGWAHKILGYSESAGLIYIDCMCNCGKYYDLYLKSKAIFYGRCPKGALCLLWQGWLGTVKLGIFLLDKLVSIGR